jgi:NAD(P)-dependent dehydrogenase (short-subunit alcohol dehydrogenase family)
MNDGVVVVTGAASGIGAAIVATLRRSGRKVVCVDRRLPDDEPADIWILGDVGDSDTHRRAAIAAAEAGRLDGWVNNAGITENNALHAMSDAQIRVTLETNLFGALAGTRAALNEYLRTETPGVLVNISSIHGRGAFPGTPNYDASKGGIEALTRYTAAEYGHLGIRANAVAPGAIRTEMVNDAIRKSVDPEKTERNYAALHPLARLGEPEEVARAVAFLLSNEASFISGVVLPVDGGAAARVFAFPAHTDVPDAFAASPEKE